jgi:hypothetical protein
MGRCETARTGSAALLPWGTRVEHKTGTLNGYTSDVGYITLAERPRDRGRMFARGGTNRPKTIARAARPSTTASPAVRLARRWRSRARRQLSPVAPPRHRSRENRPIPEAELVERYLKRIAWPTKLTELSERRRLPPLPSVVDTCCWTRKARRCRPMELAKKLEQWRDRGRAKRAS